MGQFIWGAAMDRKWILFGLIFLLLGSVSAADLESHDFDDYFSMDVPKGANFTNETISFAENGTDNVIVDYEGDKLEITYADAPLLFKNHSSDYYEVMFDLLYPGYVLNSTGSEGNLTVFEAFDDFGETFPVVGTANGNRMIIVIGDDLDLVKQMGASIRFK